ncbi:hypothetical protein BJ165DRAFT_1482961 [Panaeolus papilionaceus]|nr:hypothetical protein BJ165DRAFT_1482961 [Panaeolus papilionaceus]
MHPLLSREHFQIFFITFNAHVILSHMHSSRLTLTSIPLRSHLPFILTCPSTMIPSSYCPAPVHFTHQHLATFFLSGVSSLHCFFAYSLLPPLHFFLYICSVSFALHLFLFSPS